MPPEIQRPRVLVTREDPGPLAEAVVRAGGDPVLLPLLVTRWIDFELPERRTLDDYDWVAFTSVRGLEALARQARKRGWSWPPAPRCAAVGDRTAHELQAQGWMPDCVADEGTARSLLDCLLGQGVLGTRVLLPCSALAEPTLPDGLREGGALVDVAVAYTTETVWKGAPERLPLLARDLSEILVRGCVATCASPSAVRALVDLAFAAGALDALRRVPVAGLGPTTAAAAQDAGLRCQEAEGRTLAGLARKAVELGFGQLARAE
jgi:uroporphyrinogen-III synthase